VNDDQQTRRRAHHSLSSLAWVVALADQLGTVLANEIQN
jgi:hypothetical protein